jgi:hypothetical protein
MKMSLAVALAVSMCLIYTTSAALIFYPELPVDQRDLYKAQVALNRWERHLDNTYGTPY